MVVLARGCVGCFRLSRLLFPVSRARRIRAAIRVARYGNLSPRAGRVLRGQHPGEFLRFLSGDGGGGVVSAGAKQSGEPLGAAFRGRGGVGGTWIFRFTGVVAP